jgi:hypothetical protein
MVYFMGRIPDGDIVFVAYGAFSGEKGLKGRRFIATRVIDTRLLIHWKV